MAKPKYQLLDALRSEEKKALEADIAKRGVMVAVEVDENGDILDGHHRVEIADRLGKPYKTITRRFKTEEEKEEHVFKLNLCRRHLAPWQWGQLFERLLELKGVKRGQGTRNDLTSLTIREVAKDVGVDPKTAEFRLKAWDRVKALPAKERKEVLENPDKSVQAVRREAEKAKPKPKVAPPKDKYQCIVVDPPWPIQKIERECRPNQAEVGYKTMTLPEIMALPIPEIAAGHCHLYLWTTHKCLPQAFEIIEAWGFKYLVTMVWHKSGGMQPAGLPQYNCEFVLLARKGGLDFKTTKDFPCCFAGKRRKHSQKPVEFYDMVGRVSPGKRLDMFSREAHKGFDQWGDEVGKFTR